MSAADSGPASFAVRPRVAAGLIALVAFFLRLLHVLAYEPWPTNDMAVYLSTATDRLTLANLFRPEGITWFPPGYSVFMKPFLIVLPVGAALGAIQVVQALLGAWTCLLVYRLARRIHSTKAALAAMLLACFYPHFVFYTSAWMSENLFIPLYLALILVLMRAARKPSLAALYRSGLLAGAVTLVRPVAVSLAPIVLHAAFRSASREGRRRAARLRALLVFLAGAATLILPWAVRNRIAYGHFVLVAPNGAFNLAIGNQAEATGKYTEPPSTTGDIWGRMDYFNQAATGFVTNDPWGALFVVAHLKWRAFWETIPPWPLYSSNPSLFVGDLFPPFVTWRTIFTLGLVGAGVILARRRPTAWLTPACLAAYLVFYMVYFGGARFRLPAEAIFLAWAGVAVAAAAKALPVAGRAPTSAGAAAACAALAVVLAESGIAAAEARSFERSEASLLAAGEQVPVVAGSRPQLLFGGPIPIDRSAGRYLRLGFTAFRQGPHRDSPENGSVQITYLDRKGEPLPWLDNPRYFLEALPADRWVSIVFKSHIPPSAARCRVTINPQRSSPDTLILDQPILRYARGNDAAFEFAFPYLRYEE